jgi:hypothetical protein
VIYEIFDSGEGIFLQFDFENGLLFGVNMNDEAAQDMINIIQNKLNARL